MSTTKKKTMATKREKKQQQQQTAKPAKVAKTSPPALASLTNDDEPFADLLLLVEADDHAAVSYTHLTLPTKRIV